MKMKEQTVRLASTAPVLAIALALGAYTPNPVGATGGSQKQETVKGTSSSRDPARDKGEMNEGELLRKVRAELMADDSLSVTAQNVQIIPSSHGILVKGFVKSEEEKKKVSEIISKASGGKKVENEVEMMKE